MALLKIKPTSVKKGLVWIIGASSKIKLKAGQGLGGFWQNWLLDKKFSLGLKKNVVGLDIEGIGQ